MTITIYNTGTASVSAGGTTVTGAGVIWTGGNAREGDEFVIGGVRALILEVVSATELTITPWQGGNESGAAYTIYQTSSRRFDDVQIADDLQKQVAALNTDGFYHFVKSSETAPDPSLGDEGQYAFQATTGKLWLKEGGVWVYVGVFKGVSPKGPWDSGANYAANDIVSSGGSSYLAVSANTNDPPPSANWMLIAAKGEPGQDGTDGGQGPIGPPGLANAGVYNPATAYEPTEYVLDNGSTWVCTAATTGNAPPVLPTESNAWWSLLARKGQDGTGTGDVVGPAGAADGALVVFDGLSGKGIKEITDPDGALDQLGGTAVGKAVFTAVDQAAAQAAIDIADGWAAQPVGVPIPLFTNLVGVAAPPKDRSYRYILLTADQTGSGQYNEGCLTSQSVSGSAPLVIASAVVSLADSPLNGQTISLINTERRFLRAGSSGVLENDAMQTHQHPSSTGGKHVGPYNPINAGPGAAFGVVGAEQGSQVQPMGTGDGRMASETRPKNIGVAYYMRIR